MAKTQEQALARGRAVDLVPPDHMQISSPCTDGNGEHRYKTCAKPGKIRVLQQEIKRFPVLPACICTHRRGSRYEQDQDRPQVPSLPVLHTGMLWSEPGGWLGTWCFLQHSVSCVSIHRAGLALVPSLLPVPCSPGKVHFHRAPALHTAAPVTVPCSGEPL